MIPMEVVVLETFTVKTFEPLVGTPFRVHLDAGDVDLALLGVEVLKSPGEAFSLRFGGPAQPFLGQGTRDLSHPSLGRFPLFITPIAGGEGGFTYEAIFNRLKPRSGGETPASPPG
jgi:hypothetical protein